MTMSRIAKRSAWGRSGRAGLCLRVLAVGLVIAAGSLLLAAEPTDRVLQLLTDNSTGGTVGLYLKEVEGPVLAAVNEGYVFEPASTIKALIHFHAMRQVQEGNVTLETSVPWMADETKFDDDGNYMPGGDDCPTDNTVAQVDDLATVLQLMMRVSDNAATQALRDFFGDADIDSTRQLLGMNDSLYQHPIGCGADAVANHNRLTLVDAGKLYEAVATGFLDDDIRAQAYNLMIHHPANPPQVGLLLDIIEQEGQGLGLTAARLDSFRLKTRFAAKAGGYSLSDGEYTSIAGWVEIPFEENCFEAPREYVFGAFIDAADSIDANFSIGSAAELLREQIRAGLESWAVGGCAEFLNLISPGGTDVVGESHKVSARVRDHFGDPVSGITVDFSVTGGPSTVDGDPSSPSPANGSAPTDGHGYATFTYTNTQASHDVITAIVLIQPNAPKELERFISKTWHPIEASINDVVVQEGNAGSSPTTFTIALSAPATAPLTINFSTADGTATQDDYVAASGPVPFAPGDATKDLVVPVKGDTLDELDEQFSVKLLNVVSAIDVVLTDDTGVGTILDDDRDGAFSCRASVLNLAGVQPVLANAFDVPCQDEHRTLAQVTLSAGLLAVNVKGLDALTDQTPDDLESADPAPGDIGVAQSRVDAVTISTLGLNIALELIYSDAAAQCVEGPGGLTPQLSSSSSVAGLSINGVPITVGSAPLSIPLVIGTLHLNHTVTTGNSVTQRAVFLDTLLTDVIIAESKANFEGTSAHPSGNPCLQ
ncbi:MAG: hypothetical protein GEV06_15965 [Luteitalea sp.]|nr:hypothetical protein [Luteitalea sp.]